MEAGEVAVSAEEPEQSVAEAEEGEEAVTTAGAMAQAAHDEAALPVTIRVVEEEEEQEPEAEQGLAQVHQEPEQEEEEDEEAIAAAEHHSEEEPALQPEDETGHAELDHAQGTLPIATEREAEAVPPEGNEPEEEQQAELEARLAQAGHIKLEDEGAHPQMEQPRPAEADDLATLANAALTCDQAANNEVKQEETKKEPVWCDVGIIKATSCFVSSYNEPSFSHDPEHEFVTLDSLPDYAECYKIELEPGTAYKFRVAAINSCGRGPWSEVSAFKTSLPGYPGAPSSIKISKSADGAHLSWEPPSNPAGTIIEYSVCLAVRNAQQGQQSEQKGHQLAFVRVYSGPQNQTVVPNSSLAAAHIDTTSKPAIIFRIAAKNEKGFGPATQVRWLQDVVASPGGGLKPITKKEPPTSNIAAKRIKLEDI